MPREEASAGPSPRGGGTGGSRRPEAEGSAGMLWAPGTRSQSWGAGEGGHPFAKGPLSGRRRASTVRSQGLPHGRRKCHK